MYPEFVAGFTFAAIAECTARFAAARYSYRAFWLCVIIQASLQFEIPNSEYCDIFYIPFLPEIPAARKLTPYVAFRP